jgi:hypothetical protein
MAGATALGGGFAQGTTWENIRLLAVATVFPPVALVLAGYNITLFGVLLATLLVPIVEWQVNKREYKTTRPAAER